MLAMAGVNMRLAAGAVRELHWHKTAEVSLIALSLALGLTHFAVGVCLECKRQAEHLDLCD